MDVLLVDDSKTMRMIVHRSIRSAGFRNLDVGQAEDGAMALDTIKTNQPKLVLSDWNMPVMTGIEFLRSLRASGNSVPFGFITSEASAEIKDEAMKSGANFVITKPFTDDDMHNAIAKYL